MSAQMINMAFEDAQLADLEFITIGMTEDFINAYFQMYSKILMF